MGIHGLAGVACATGFVTCHRFATPPAELQKLRGSLLHHFRLGQMADGEQPLRFASSDTFDHLDAAVALPTHVLEARVCVGTHNDGIDVLVSGPRQKHAGGKAPDEDVLDDVGIGAVVERHLAVLHLCAITTALEVRHDLLYGLLLDLVASLPIDQVDMVHHDRVALFQDQI